MHVVWKYPFQVTDEVEFTMPVGARVLSVATQNGVPCLWAEVDPDVEESVVRRFRVVGTGHSFDPEGLRYHGTFLLMDGAFVGHVYEESVSERSLYHELADPVAAVG